MTRLVEIRQHVSSMSELLDIVGAMRSLAAMRVQEAQRALPGIGRYADTMAAGIGSALSLLAESEPGRAGMDGPLALVLCMAEHGFVGGFNERLVEAATGARERHGALFVLGSRGAALATERGWKTTWMGPMATRPAGVLQTIRRLAAELYARIARREIARVDVLFARYHQAGAPTIERHKLLPLDLAALAAGKHGEPPLHNLPPPSLLEKLAEEFVLARLTEAAVQSIASENAARFACMEAAHDNVSKKLDELRQAERQARQAEITTELLDLVTGAQAMAGGGNF